MSPGDCACLILLKQSPELNGTFCEILTDPKENEVPEKDGVVRKKLRCGVKFIPSGRTGYVPVSNLEHVGGPETIRGHMIHHFGTEDWPE